MLADRLEDALWDGVKLLAPSIPDRAVMLAALEDPSRDAGRAPRGAPQQAHRRVEVGIDYCAGDGGDPVLPAQRGKSADTFYANRVPRSPPAR